MGFKYLKYRAEGTWKHGSGRALRCRCCCRQHPPGAGPGRAGRRIPRLPRSRAALPAPAGPGARYLPVDLALPPQVEVRLLGAQRGDVAEQGQPRGAGREAGRPPLLQQLPHHQRQQQRQRRRQQQEPGAAARCGCGCGRGRALPRLRRRRPHRPRRRFLLWAPARRPALARGGSARRVRSSAALLPPRWGFFLFPGVTQGWSFGVCAALEPPLAARSRRRPWKLRGGTSGSLLLVESLWNLRRTVPRCLSQRHLGLGPMEPAVIPAGRCAPHRFLVVGGWEQLQLRCSRCPGITDSGGKGPGLPPCPRRQPGGECPAPCDPAARRSHTECKGCCYLVERIPQDPGLELRKRPSSGRQRLESNVTVPCHILGKTLHKQAQICSQSHWFCYCITTILKCILGITEAFLAHYNFCAMCF